MKRRTSPASLLEEGGGQQLLMEMSHKEFAAHRHPRYPQKYVTHDWGG